MGASISSNGRKEEKRRTRIDPVFSRWVTSFMYCLRIHVSVLVLVCVCLCICVLYTCLCVSVYVCIFVYLCIIHRRGERGKEKKMHGSCIQQLSHQFDVLSALRREQNLYCWH